MKFDIVYLLKFKINLPKALIIIMKQLELLIIIIKLQNY